MMNLALSVAASFLVGCAAAYATAELDGRAPTLLTLSVAGWVLFVLPIIIWVP